MPCGCCLLAGIGAFVPRLVLLFVWLFTDGVSRAFDGGWVAPLVGLVFLPYTTLAYVGVWNWGSSGVNGFDWFVVILAFVFDIGHYTSGAYGRANRA